MFEDLTYDEKLVLDLYATAEKDNEFKELEFVDMLKSFKNIDEINLVLFDKGYINLKVYNRAPNNIQTEYVYSNKGHILTDVALRYYDIEK